MKYVLVTGGVVSGLGKGVTASSIGVLLKACGLRLTAIKIDPYLNTDAGTMSPFELGEVFVLDDGGEVDLDLGNYERFLDVKLTCDNSITTGKIYQFVIDKERRGDYLGKTVQVMPHITDAIQEWIERAAMIPVDREEGPPDVCVIELGGTIGTTIRHNDSGILDAGDIESMPFIEALGSDNFCVVHVSLVPVLNEVGEQALDENIKEKLSRFCHVPVADIITLNDVTNIWHIPLLLREQKAHEAIIKLLNLQGIAKEPALEEWTSRARTYDTLHDPVRIVMVGKYTGHSDSYLSVLEALLHASIACYKKLVVDWVRSSDLEDSAAIESPDLYGGAWKRLKGADGILVPGGFGDRGVEGKILAAKYARENNVPFLGICLGMQIAVIEFARSVLNLHDANSTEFDPDTTNPCIVFMPEGSKTHKGATMHLGSRRTFFEVTDCISAKLYGNVSFIDERHRHRYEACLFTYKLRTSVNPEMVAELEKAGLSFVGKDETKRRMEIVEFHAHPYFIGVQFHPEFKSRPGKPSALFLGLIGAACGQLDSLLQNPSHCSNPTKRHIFSDSFSPAKSYRNTNLKKPVKSLPYRNLYSNGNGVHV
ncbi:CTP synthase [Musa troglodytarum]|uniref:CTP synthase n=1 Tax=Musa troglodytarum TaxID=320322 RepID=A0A9E7ECH6_9LILI|nr:CTP synthase [Musa troglodytarum]